MMQLQSIDLSTEQIVEKLTYLDYDKAKQLIDLIQYYVGDKLNGLALSLVQVQVFLVLC